MIFQPPSYTSSSITSSASETTLVHWLLGNHNGSNLEQLLKFDSPFNDRYSWRRSGTEWLFLLKICKKTKRGAKLTKKGRAVFERVWAHEASGMARDHTHISPRRLYFDGSTLKRNYYLFSMTVRYRGKPIRVRDSNARFQYLKYQKSYFDRRINSYEQQRDKNGDRWFGIACVLMLHSVLFIGAILK